MEPNSVASQSIVCYYCVCDSLRYLRHSVLERNLCSKKWCLSKYMRTQEQTRMHIEYLFPEKTNDRQRKGEGWNKHTHTHHLKAYPASLSFYTAADLPSKWRGRNPECFSPVSPNLAVVRSVNPKINISGWFFSQFVWGAHICTCDLGDKDVTR